MEFRPIAAGDEPALQRFFARIPEADRTFLKEDVDDPAIAAAWARPGSARTIAVEAGEVVGSVAAHCLRRAHCPVVLVPVGGKDDDDADGARLSRTAQEFR